jgi:hypothetical protein
MILIVCALGTVIYSYTIQLNQTQQNNVLNNLAVSTGRAQERFRVTTAWWSGSGTSVRLTILNYGLNDITISDVYVNGRKVTAWTSGRLTPIYIGKIQNIVFTSPVTVTAGASYQITVVSQRGDTVAVTWIP